LTASGVAKVGVTHCGNISFVKKVTIFLVIALKSDDLFTHRHHSYPSAFQVILHYSPLFFVNSAAKKLDVHQGVTPWMVSPVTPLLTPT